MKIRSMIQLRKLSSSDGYNYVLKGGTEKFIIIFRIRTCMSKSGKAYQNRRVCVEEALGTRRGAPGRRRGGAAEASRSVEEHCFATLVVSQTDF